MCFVLPKFGLFHARNYVILLSGTVKYLDKESNMSSENRPSILVRLVHSVPHFNTTFDRVNNTFDPNSAIYKEVSIYLFICQLVDIIQ